MQYVDDRQVQALFRDFPTKVRNSAISAAARKALKPVVSGAASELEGKRSQWGTDGSDGFSHFDFVKRYIRVFTSKSKTGAYVTVKGPDIPVGDREWTLKGFALLLAKGAQNRVTKSGAARGDFTGIGDFVKAGFNRARELATFRALLLTELESAIKRARKKL